MADKPEDHLVVFQEKAIRRIWHKEEWWFSVVDVCAVLTDSADAGAYWRKLKQRLGAEGSEVVTFCHGLKLEAPDGKQRVTDCANTEGLFRIIQSIPSPKADPFKRWLAQVGYERVKEIENPELASARARELYQAKGYPQVWIEKRLRSITVRGEFDRRVEGAWRQGGQGVFDPHCRNRTRHLRRDTRHAPPAQGIGQDEYGKQSARSHDRP